MIMRSNLALLVLLLVLPIAGGAQERADTVSLRFDWPVGLTARVEQQWLKEKSSPSRTDSILVVSSFRMRVDAHPRGRLISIDSMSIPQLSAGADSNEFVQQLVNQLGVLMPSYVVNNEGEFVEVADIARMKSAVDSLLAPMLRSMSELSPQAHAFIRSMISEQTLTASAAQEWNAMVGTWVGADWEVGAVYEVEAEEASPIMPGLVIPMHYQFSAVERIPCTEADTSLACTELRMVSTPDPEATKAAVQKLFGQLGVSEGEEVLTAFESMEVENELTVIANPATLVPYLVVREKRVRVRTGGSSAESGEEGTQYERKISRFHYDK